MNIWSEVRHASRGLLREPAFTGVALLSLAIGIGANTAIFSIVNGVLLRPLPYREPERLVALREVLPAFVQTFGDLPVNAEHFVEWQKQTKSFAGLAAISPATVTLNSSSEPEQIDAMRVSAGMFDVLGIHPARGRGFLSGEDQEGREHVAVLSDALWRRRFNADPTILGRTIQLDQRPFTVVGVLPVWFQFPNISVMQLGRVQAGTAEVFLPLAFSKQELGVLMGQFNYNVVARLKKSTSAAQANAELAVIGQQLAKASGEKVELRASVTPLLDAMAGGSRRGLLVLLGAVGAVLLIVCVNLANLLLARAERMSRESAIRAALGASNGRLLRQALATSLIIALVGGTLGVALAAGGLGALVKLAPADIPRLNEVRLDARVALFALAITTLTGLLFGLAPAWRISHVDPQSILKNGRAVTSGSDRLRLRGMLVAIEVGLSTMLLAAAALLMSSFFRIMRAEKGFRAPTVLSAEVQIPQARYTTPEAREQFYKRLLPELTGQSGVLSASIITALPLAGETWVDSVSVPGDARSDWAKPAANVRFTSQDYFRTMGISLRAGRTFSDNDRNRDVAIVSERLAAMLWPGIDPVGRQIQDGERAREVIGVAGDVRVEANKPPVPMVYRPYWEWPDPRMRLVARSAGDPFAIAGAMRAAVRRMDSSVPLSHIRTMQEVLEDSIAQERFQMMLAAVFAAAAVLMASLGIYGVVSYSVARRSSEMGIRMALGAQTGKVYRMVIRQAMVPVVSGLAMGVAGAVAAGTVLNKLLYEISPRNPEVLAGVVVLLAVVGLASCAVPAGRATRIDPLEALRCE